MLKIFKAKIIILAVGILVSSGVVFATTDTKVINEESKSVNIAQEERWRLAIGSEKYGTKYTIKIDEKSYEYYLKYKEIVPSNKSIGEAKFIGHYWGMKTKEEDPQRDENYIYTEDKAKFTREDVIEFLEIKDEKLAALIKDGSEFSLFIEPYYTYKTKKWGDINRSNVRELYAMLPEVKNNVSSYANAIDENGNIMKSRIEGIEFLRETIIDAIESIKEDESEEYVEFKNEYIGVINDEMLNKGWIAYHYESGIKNGEFIKMVSEALWPNYVYKEPREGEHWATPYVYTLNHSILYAPNYTPEKLEMIITRAEAAEIICKFYLIVNEDEKIDKDETYIKLCKDESTIKNSSTRHYINGCIQFGIMSVFEDGTFRADEVLTKEQAKNILYKALNN